MSDPSGPDPKAGHARQENLGTQPLKTYKVFNRPGVLTEGWYPLLPSSSLKRGDACSRVVLDQRLALYRGADGRVRAFDAFCPHMGADLGNGSVEGNALRCALHGWRFGEGGRLEGTACGARPAAEPALAAYPVEERYGLVWVYAGREAPYPVPSPPGLDEAECSWLSLGTADLYAHHHVLMASGIDLQHFFSVHGVEADFRFRVVSKGPLLADWEVEGALGETGLAGALARLGFGDRLRYSARFGGGTVGTLTYWARPPFGPLHILWGCIPLSTGLSRVHIALVCPKARGVLGPIRDAARLALTGLLFWALKKDDAPAFRNVRFQPAHLLPADASVARFIQWVEDLPVSSWSGTAEAKAFTGRDAETASLPVDPSLGRHARS